MEPIELKSPEINELLSRPPKGLIRWGSSLLLGILLIVLAGSCLFSYPEVIEAKAFITTANPPVWLTARTTTSIKELYAHNQMTVRQGQLIALLNNTATTQDIKSMKQWLSDSTLYQLDALAKQPQFFTRHLNAGELQSYWTEVVNRFTAYYATSAMDHFNNKRQTSAIEMGILENNLAVLRKKETRQKQAQIIQKQSYSRDNTLFKKGLIASEAVEMAEQAYLSSALQLDETRIAINNLLSAKQVLVRTIEDETSVRAQTLMSQKQAYLLSLKELAAALKSWEQTYLLISPVNGTLTFPEKRSPLQQVQTGDKLFAIIPDKAGPIQAVLEIPMNGSGKVKTGQKARIFIDGYPYLEYGTIGVTIQSISLMPDANSMYKAIGRVSQPLVTNYGKRLTLNGELVGTAEIRTKELRLIQRLFNPLKYLVNHQ